MASYFIYIYMSILEDYHPFLSTFEYIVCIMKVQNATFLAIQEYNLRKQNSYLYEAHLIFYLKMQIFDNYNSLQKKEELLAKDS